MKGSYHNSLITYQLLVPLPPAEAMILLVVGSEILYSLLLFEKNCHLQLFLVIKHSVSQGYRCCTHVSYPQSHPPPEQLLVLTHFPFRIPISLLP